MDENLVTLPFRGLPPNAVIAISDDQLQLLLNGDVITYEPSQAEYDQTKEDFQRAVWYCGTFWRVVTLPGMSGARLHNDVPKEYQEKHGYMSKEDARHMARRIAIEFLNKAEFSTQPDWLEDEDLYKAFDSAIQSGKLSFDEQATSTAETQS